MVSKKFDRIFLIPESRSDDWDDLRNMSPEEFAYQCCILFHSPEECRLPGEVEPLRVERSNFNNAFRIMNNKKADPIPDCINCGSKNVWQGCDMGLTKTYLCKTCNREFFFDGDEFYSDEKEDDNHD